MKIRSFITTYNRPELLTKVVNDLGRFGIIPVIKNDGSDYEVLHPNTLTHEHRGKEGFWITWDEMLKDCQDDADLYLFMPDDFLDIDIKRILELHEQFKDTAYVYNIINDGRSGMWTGIQERQIDDSTIMCGMVDCGFFCNSTALRRLGFKVPQLEATSTASGVGQYLSTQFLKARVLMYKPVKSLATHGIHESKMHYEERLRNPLKSI